jgi:peroxiredoxin
MRKLLFGALVVVMASLTACQQNGTKISGNITGLGDTKAYLNKLSNGMPLAMDTVDVKEGKFKFVIDSVIEPQLLVIFFEGKQEPVVFFGEKGSIKISALADSLSKAKIEGSKVNDIFKKFNDEMPGMMRSNAIREEFMQAQMGGDMSKVEGLRTEMEGIIEQQRTYVDKFVDDNTANAVGAFLALNIAPTMELPKFKEMIDKFEASLGTHVYVAEMKKMYGPMEKMANAMANLEIGKVAPDFTLLTKDGVEVTLSSFRGKYLLVDFWASWCAPCRQENPNVVAAYKKFNKKGFEILSVSVDEDREKWQEAIVTDKLTWSQVIDVRGEGSVAEIYAIQSIPTTFLLDREGVIVAKNLRGEQLNEKLTELLK